MPKRGRYLISDPKQPMTLEDRAFQMAVHPLDLDELGFHKREAFFLAHLKAAVSQAQNPVSKTEVSHAVCAEITLYPEGGRTQPIGGLYADKTPIPWMSMTFREYPEQDWAWDGRIILDGQVIPLGVPTTAKLLFMSGQKAVDVFMRNGGKIFLWEGRIIGEGRIKVS